MSNEDWLGHEVQGLYEENAGLKEEVERLRLELFTSRVEANVMRDLKRDAEAEVKALRARIGKVLDSMEWLGNKVDAEPCAGVLVAAARDIRAAVSPPEADPTER